MASFPQNKKSRKIQITIPLTIVFSFIMFFQLLRCCSPAAISSLLNKSHRDVISNRLPPQNKINISKTMLELLEKLLFMSDQANPFTIVRHSGHLETSVLSQRRTFSSTNACLDSATYHPRAIIELSTFNSLDEAITLPLNHRREAQQWISINISGLKSSPSSVLPLSQYQKSFHKVAKSKLR